ncbi:uncharacterized protein TNCV_3048661 [Trichonephila clavipes]|nr:uncharacterized protein TNCV_3048661 [Trichonephila clavipes]
MRTASQVSFSLITIVCKKSHDIPSSPRAAAVAKFRLLTGHDCLCAHLFRFNLVTSPICVLCDTGQDMTAAHLDECSALNDLNCINLLQPGSLNTLQNLLQPGSLNTLQKALRYWRFPDDNEVQATVAKLVSQTAPELLHPGYPSCR